MSKNTESEEVEAELMGNHPGVDEIPDSELIFRAQHKLRDLIEDHWKTGVGIISIGLLATLIYGVTATKKIEAQEAASTMLAQLDRSMPPVSELSLQGLFPLDDPSDDRRSDRLEAIAERYEAQANETSGSAGAAAWNRAGAIWLRLGMLEKAQQAYSNGTEGGGLYGVAANNGLASIAAAQGDTATAIEHLTLISEGNHGGMSATALISISRISRAAGDLDTAREALESVISEYPETSNLDRINAELQIIESTGEQG